MSAARDIAVGGLLQELLGCDWGRAIWTADDGATCQEQAVQIVVLHEGDDHETALKLCPKHRDRVLRETTPREIPDA